MTGSDHGAAVGTACRRLRIRGRVQGVGYREWTRREADSLGLTGWVRNCRDGSVEIVACGDRAALDGLVTACRRGPPLARVDGVERHDEPVGNWRGFTVGRTEA